MQLPKSSSKYSYMVPKSEIVKFGWSNLIWMAWYCIKFPYEALSIAQKKNKLKSQPKIDTRSFQIKLQKIKFLIEDFAITFNWHEKDLNLN